MGLFVILVSGIAEGDGGEVCLARVNELSAALKERTLVVDDRDGTFHQSMMQVIAQLCLHIRSTTYEQA